MNEQGPPRLERLIREWREVDSRNVSWELRRRRYFAGASEARRAKARRAANRLRPK